MQALAIEAKSLESAQRLFDALARFGPKLLGDARSGYRVEVDVTQERRVLEVLDTLRDYVGSDGGPARVDLGGRKYTVHPDPEPQRREVDARSG